jgi:two pore calcium channel protein
MLAGLAICLLMFAWTGIVVFAGTPEAEEKFKDGPSAISNLWILFEGGAGNPDVWLPAFKQHYLSFFFFLAYCLLTVYILNSMLLSNIYDFYKEQLTASLTAFFDRRAFASEQAFLLLKDEGDIVKMDRWQEFYSCVCDSGFGYRFAWESPTDRSYNEARAKQFFLALDKDQSGSIDMYEFKCLVDAILDEESYIPTTPAPKVLSSRWVKPLYKLFTEGIPFGEDRVLVTWDHFVDGVIVIDVLLVLFQTMKLMNGSGAPVEETLGLGSFWFWVLFAFSLFYFAAVSLKLAVFGFERFWNMKPVQHRFDFLNVYPLFAGEVLCVFLGSSAPGLLLRLVVILHIIRIFRIIQYLPALNYLARFLVKLAPTYYRMGMLLVLLFYMYTTIGVQFFGGLIYKGNPALKGSDFANSDYWAFNFNDFPTGMVTLFCLMMLNNWWVFSAAFVKVAHTKWAILYSISFFIIVNLIVLNILIALILDCASSLKDSSSAGAESGDLSYESVLKKVLLSDEADLSSSSSRNLLPSYGATSAGNSPTRARADSDEEAASWSLVGRRQSV